MDAFGKPRTAVRLPILLGLVLGVSLAGRPADGMAEGSSTAAVEALRRLHGLDLDSNPAVKGAVLRVLETVRGTPVFVELVRDFRLSGREEGLLEVAARLPESEAGAEAIRLLLEGGGAERLRMNLRQGESGTRRALLRALARTVDARAAPLLAEVAVDPALDSEMRGLVIRGLARSETGARMLLDLGKGERMPQDAGEMASRVLAQAPWPAIREEAARVFGVPRAAGAASVAMAELLGLRGDAGLGARVFRSEKAGCLGCHRVGSEGVDFGPALGGIGAKLGRQALYESILDPSAGIAFGYEGWEVETRSGDEVLGIVASETEEELAIRQSTGLVTRVRKADLARRERLRLSVMPAGLAESLTREELVNLVEYLASLRGP